MENNQIKVLFVKQQYDPSGPWSSYEYKDNMEMQILKLFNTKISLYEMLLFFKADTIIIPKKTKSHWLNRFIDDENYINYMNNMVTNVFDIMEQDLSKYDIIITHDPILGPYMGDIKKKYPNIVTAYILAEHSSNHLHEIGIDYDLYLDHTLESTDKIEKLPQFINFPFPRVPDIIRKMFFVNKNKLYYDYRSVNYFIVKDILKNESLDKDGYGCTKEQSEFFYNSFYSPIELIKINDKSLNPFMFIGKNDECLNYYEKLNQAKYFVTIANRIGQSALDAVSAGCITFGNNLSKTHSLVLHPYTLMYEPFTNDDIITKINYLELNLEFQKEIIDYQDQQLKKYFIDGPINIIKTAINLKNIK